MRYLRQRSGLCFFILWVFTGHSIAQTKNLDYYINRGLSNSPLLKDYDNQVFSNAIDSQRLGATFKPQVSGIANNSLFPVVNGYGYDQVLSNIISFNDVVNVNQAFIGKKNLSAQYNGFSLLSDSVRNAKKLTALDLKRAITAQYITAYGDMQQLNFYEDIYKTLNGQQGILKNLTENNIYRQTDYLTFLVTLKQQDLQLRQWQIQYRNDYAMLNYLCGIFDTSEATLDKPDISLQNLQNEAVSIFFYRYFTDSLILENNMAVLNYSYRPKLSAFANAGFVSSFLYEPYKNFGFGVGMNLNVPIYDGHQRLLQQQKLKLLQNTNADYKDFFARQYGQQLAMLRQQLAATESLISDIDEQVKYSEGLINVNGKLLETGETKIADLVIAVNNYLTAKNLLTQNNIGRMQIINQLNYWNR
jgi:outer membrane protein TolC